MKACVIQPPYSFDYDDSDACFTWEIDALEQCDPSMDLIVLPEYSDAPALLRGKDDLALSHQKYHERLLKKAAETAKRCCATLFVCCIYETAFGPRNTIVAFSKEGQEVGYYYKQHLVPSEMYKLELDKEYTWEFTEPTVVEIDGIRYGFLICYDFYFYEMFANMARKELDVIIGCSHQRSDAHETLETIGKFLCYNTNAYLVRSSVSLGEDSSVGGCSMIVSPEGKILANMKSRTGMATAEFDPKARYLKPAGFGNPPAPHHHYIDAGRRPWKYRPAGSAICRYNEIMEYPRICAHRGFNSIAPENSLPAFGAAVAMGAEEIEFDLWAAKDSTIVSIHDKKLERVSNGSGNIWDHTYAELSELDFGSKYGAEFSGMKIPTFEDILKKFACHVIMNIHIKSQSKIDPLPEETLKEIIRLIDKYDCRRHVYFMSGNPTILDQLRCLAPDITRCAGAGDPSYDIVEKAIAYDCKKIQLFFPHFEQLGGEAYVRDAIKRAHHAGISVNLFQSDDLEEAKAYLDMGVDTILTNDYHRISAAIEGRNKYLLK